MTWDSVARCPGQAFVPTAPVPMAPQVRCIKWYRNHVAHAGRDIPIAARTQVGLVGFVRLYAPDITIGGSCVVQMFRHVPYPMKAQTRSAAATIRAPATNT